MLIPLSTSRAIISAERKGHHTTRVASRGMSTDHEHEHPSRWATIVSVSAKIGCTAQTLLDWVKKAEVDSGKRAGVPTDMAEKLKALERENRNFDRRTRFFEGVRRQRLILCTARGWAMVEHG
jgi:transposase-like protein